MGNSKSKRIKVLEKSVMRQDLILRKNAQELNEQKSKVQEILAYVENMQKPPDFVDYVEPKTPKTPKFKKAAIPKKLKTMVWNKYIGEEIGRSRCVCCFSTYITQSEFHCGHVIAESKGGELTVDNLRPICAQCNLSMGSMDMFEFQQKYGLIGTDNGYY